MEKGFFLHGLTLLCLLFLSIFVVLICYLFLFVLIFSISFPHLDLQETDFSILYATIEKVEDKNAGIVKTIFQFVLYFQLPEFRYKNCNLEDSENRISSAFSITIGSGDIFWYRYSIRHCQAQPKAKLKLQLCADMVTILFKPTTNPPINPPTHQTLKMDHAQTPKMDKLGPNF